jgi:hypothetical protein
MNELRYKILKNEFACIELLEAKVSNLVKQGWKPVGGPFIVGAYVCQAMIQP